MSRERIVIALAAPDTAVEVVERARRRGFDSFAYSGNRPVEPRTSEKWWRRELGRFVPVAPPGDAVPILSPSTPEELEAALAAVASDSSVAIAPTHDRVIPFESVVAARGRRFRAWAMAATPDEVPGALGALEHGADRVVVDIRTAGEIERLEERLESVGPGSLAWSAATVRSVTPAGLGDRVLVDTTSLLRPDEGLLVGSAAAFLFHVRSEAEGSRFSRARPFRVNAGAAHSYVLMADGATRYLAELEPGEAVLAVVPDGASRPVRIGRVKIERRPMVVVRADDGGRVRTVFLQEAETVRLTTETGPASATDLSPEVRVRGVRLPPGRHLGRAVDETIEER